MAKTQTLNRDRSALMSSYCIYKMELVVIIHKLKSVESDRLV